MPSVQLLNPKLKYIGNDKGLLALDAVKDVYTLVIHYIKLSRKRQTGMFLTYPIPEFNGEDIVLEIM